MKKKKRNCVLETDARHWPTVYGKDNNILRIRNMQEDEFDEDKFRTGACTSTGKNGNITGFEIYVTRYVNLYSSSDSDDDDDYSILDGTALTCVRTLSIMDRDCKRTDTILPETTCNKNKESEIDITSCKINQQNLSMSYPFEITSIITEHGYISDDPTDHFDDKYRWKIEHAETKAAEEREAAIERNQIISVNNKQCSSLRYNKPRGVVSSHIADSIATEQDVLLGPVITEHVTVNATDICVNNISQDNKCYTENYVTNDNNIHTQNIGTPHSTQTNTSANTSNSDLPLSVLKNRLDAKKSKKIETQQSASSGDSIPLINRLNKRRKQGSPPKSSDSDEPLATKLKKKKNTNSEVINANGKNTKETVNSNENLDLITNSDQLSGRGKRKRSRRGRGRPARFSNRTQSTTRTVSTVSTRASKKRNVPNEFLSQGSTQSSPALPDSQSSGSQVTFQTRDNRREIERNIQASVASSRNAERAERRMEDAYDRLEEGAPPPEGTHPPTHRRYMRLFDINNVVPFDLGEINQTCSYCGARFFARECAPDNNGNFKLCCEHGKVPKFERLGELPELFQDLYIGETDQSKEFLKNIRKYNNTLAMTSLKGDLCETVTGPNVCYKMQGQVYHRSCGTRVPRNKNPCLNQLYFVSPSDASDFRKTFLKDPDLPLMETLDRLLREVNPYVQGYMNMGQIMDMEEAEALLNGRPIQRVALVMQPSYERLVEDIINPPAYENDLVAVFVGEDLPDHPDLIVRNNHIIKKLSYCSPVAMPLQYPVIYPLGEQGWHIGLLHNPQYATNVRNNVTFRQHYSNILMIRDPVDVLHKARALKMQFVTNMGALAEQKDLDYIVRNQDKFLKSRRDLLERYSRENRIDEDDRPDIGRFQALPSSFANSFRGKRIHFINECAIGRLLGYPNLFITTTCRLTWPEFEKLGDLLGRNFLHPEHSRVFYGKVKLLIHRLVVEQMLGKVIHYTLVIEYTKPGHPHAHMIVTLHDNDKLTTPEEVNECSSATLPDRHTQPELYEKVTDFMLHNKCSGEYKDKALCIDPKTKKCSKRFPKPYRDTTEFIPQIGRWVYARPDDGRIHKKGPLTYTNRDVIPYNPMLLMEMDSHCNVEVIGDQFQFRYLFKYIEKTPNSTRFEVVTWDEANDGGDIINEIRNYIEMRTLTASEAAWHIFRFPNRFSNHKVVVLTIHLPGGEQLAFEDGNIPIALNQSRHTMLQAFFNLCRVDDFARRLTFDRIPRFYRWMYKEGVWQRRDRQLDRTIGRIADISPSRKELFFLKLLLLTVPGPESFEDLLTHNGVHPTFYEACLSRRLVNGNDQSRRCLQIAVTYQNEKQLQRLFARLIVFDLMMPIQELYEEFSPHMMTQFRQRGLTVDEASERLMRVLARLYVRSGGCLEDQREFFGDVQIGRRERPLPVAGIQEEEEEVEEEPVEEVHVDEHREQMHSLNDAQRVAFDAVMAAVDSYIGGEIDTEKCFFVEAAAGCGKTFLYNVIIDAVRLKSKKSLVCAWSGIAASLLRGGVTCHNAFRFPVDVNATARSLLDPAIHVHQWTCIKECAIVIIDEISMVPQNALRIIDEILRRAHNSNVFMGGIPVLIGGDFRQVMPVPNEGQSAIALSLKSSPLLTQFRRYTLNVNQRAAPDQIEFSQFLISVGEFRHDRIPSLTNYHIVIPPQCVVTNMQQLIDRTFLGNIVINGGDCCILTPLNKHSNLINNVLIRTLPGEMITLLSENRDDQDTVGDIPVERMTIEHMQALDPPGYPPHELKVKIGCIVMLLRNMDVSEGLCNGTKLRITNIHKDLIVGTILGGHHDGKEAWIPKIHMQLTQGKAKTFTRIQFPVRLAYASTINKAQGRTLRRVGVYLPDPVFSHGQLYVAFSRVSRMEDLGVYVKDTRLQGKRGKHVVAINRVHIPFVRWET